MSDTKWHSGPPPSIGWWPASVSRSSNVYRWWNGEYWSQDVSDYNPARLAEYYASRRECSRNPIEWKHRPKNWPARSFT